MSAAAAAGTALVLAEAAAFPDAPVTFDPVASLLADKRSPATRAGYAGDLRQFFRFLAADASAEPTPDAVAAFVGLAPVRIATILAAYKAAMLEARLSEATVNRRLTAVRALLRLCYRLGLSTTDGRGLVEGERHRPYRDTRGLDLPTLRRLIALPGTDTPRGLRDTAALRLMAECAWWRAEVCRASVADFDAAGRRLMVTGKARGTQQEPVTLSPACADAIAAYLAAAGHGGDPDAPLFAILDRRPGHRGRRLTPCGLHTIITGYGHALGVRLSPHRLRHTAITLALDLTDGDVHGTQRLARMSDVRTLMVYDHSRRDRQGQISRAISEAL